MAYHMCNEDVMSPNGTHASELPKAESQTATIRSQEHRRAARLKCALNVRLAQKPPLLRMSAAMLLRPDRGCLTFSLRSIQYAIDDGASSLCGVTRNNLFPWARDLMSIKCGGDLYLQSTTPYCSRPTHLISELNIVTLRTQNATTFLVCGTFAAAIPRPPPGWP